MTKAEKIAILERALERNIKKGNVLQVIRLRNILKSY